jgi:hypothetical protein
MSLCARMKHNIEGSLEQGMFWAEFTEKSEANQICLVNVCQKDNSLENK